MDLKIYRGITISVKENGDFEANIEGSITTTMKLSELEAKIDKYAKAKIDIPIIKIEGKGWGTPKEILSGKITSLESNQAYSQAWFSMENGDRGKGDKFYHDTPENRVVAHEIINLVSQINKLEQQKNTLYERLAIVNLNEIAVAAMNAQQRNAIGLLHKVKGLTDSLQANFIRERYKLGKDGKMTFNQARDYINYLFTLSDVEQELK